MEIVGRDTDSLAGSPLIGRRGHPQGMGRSFQVWPMIKGRNRCVDLVPEHNRRYACPSLRRIKAARPGPWPSPWPIAIARVAPFTNGNASSLLAHGSIGLERRTTRWKNQW
jgi:hypothetical protein